VVVVAETLRCSGLQQIWGGGGILDFTMRTHGKEYNKIINTTSSIKVLKISPSRLGSKGGFQGTVSQLNAIPPSRKASFVSGRMG
jgi:hypothetical protein